MVWYKKIDRQIRAGFIGKQQPLYEININVMETHKFTPFGKNVLLQCLPFP